MTTRINSADVLKHFRYADEDRRSAYAKADRGEMDAYHDLIFCANTHEDNARMMERLWVEQNR